MANNRLKLNFSIPLAKDRASFVQEYLTDPIFTKKPPTRDELETISNYILWGKDEDGKNAVQRKEIQILTKNSTWDRRPDEESLDALIESPVFNENIVVRPTEARPKVVKEVFSREEALQNCPPYLQEEFQRLFRNIDELDLQLNFYDLEHGKRKKAPRKELLARFTESEQNEIQKTALELDQYAYLKKRHLLVELRRQQYTLKDSYSFSLQKDVTCKGQTDNLEPEVPNFGTEIRVRPLGTISERSTSSLIFQPFADLVPKNFSEKQLEQISKYLWRKPQDSIYCFDFTNLEHVYNLFLSYFDVENGVILDTIDRSADFLLKTLEYYMDKANLTEIQKQILNLKVNGFKNSEIAERINAQFGFSYSSNYISTIFRQKIIKSINDAAKYHQLLIENLFFPEEFKRCICCGETLLRDSRNFVRKSRAKDGYVNKCKRCEKRDRDLKKEAKNGKILGQ